MFDHSHAKKLILSDYLGPTLLLGKEFDLIFRIFCPRFEKLMQDVMAADIYFSKETLGWS